LHAFIGYAYFTTRSGKTFNIAAKGMNRNKKSNNKQKTEKNRKKA